MSDITSTIARNLAAIRRERGLTLQELAELTGVSKSMLGEIERATSNPTVTVLWKITTGLKVPISRLVHEQQPLCSLVREDERRLLHEPPTSIRLIFECDHTRNFEVYQLEFQPGAEHRAGGHDQGVIEYLMVYEGEYTLIVGPQSHVLGQGDSMFFEAHHQHCYANRGAAVARAYSIIYYAQV